jgi:hypothetical protein
MLPGDAPLVRCVIHVNVCAFTGFPTSSTSFPQFITNTDAQRRVINQSNLDKLVRRCSGASIGAEQARASLLAVLSSSASSTTYRRTRKAFLLFYLRSPLITIHLKNQPCQTSNHPPNPPEPQQTNKYGCTFFASSLAAPPCPACVIIRLTIRTARIKDGCCKCGFWIPCSSRWTGWLCE